MTMHYLTYKPKSKGISLFLQDNPIQCQAYEQTQAAEYLSFALARTPIELVYSKYARELV